MVLKKSLDEAGQKSEKQGTAFDKLMRYNEDYREVNELLRELICKICRVDGDVVRHPSGIERAVRGFVDDAKGWISQGGGATDVARCCV